MAPSSSASFTAWVPWSNMELITVALASSFAKRNALSKFLVCAHQIPLDVLDKAKDGGA